MYIWSHLQVELRPNLFIFDQFPIVDKESLPCNRNDNEEKKLKKRSWNDHPQIM